MFIDRFINFFLTHLFGIALDGDRRIWFHSQNLNEDKRGDSRFPPYHGRCWLHFGMKNEIHFSWNLWTHFCGIGVSFDPGEDGWKLHLAFPPFSFWLSTSFFSRGMKRFLASERIDKWNQKYGGHQGSSRYTEITLFEIRIFSWAIWWDFCKFDWGWSSKMPKWMNFCFHIDDFFLGRMKYSTETLEERDIVISMPEGNYPAKAKMERATRKRPRWFARIETSITVDIPKGIPHEGKGENSWDCGKDALHGYGYSGESWGEAADRGTQIVLEARKKYDGDRMARYPDPATRPSVPVTPPPNNSNPSTLN